jgi:hypothetical protein
MDIVSDSLFVKANDMSMVWEIVYDVSWWTMGSTTMI